jgi:mono/diheme cytochrome c family protein
MRRAVFISCIVLLVVALIASFATSFFDLRASTEPGKIERYVATRLKHILVRRNSRGTIPPEVSDLPASLVEGQKLYEGECASCHGPNGNVPTDAGRWMNPRAANLASEEVQRYTDAEVFWVVKNGIRLSGMPAFGQVESDAHIGNLVKYVRTLRSPAPKNQSNGDP